MQIENITEKTEKNTLDTVDSVPYIEMGIVRILSRKNKIICYFIISL